MTGRERLIKVLKGKKVDRVPVAPFIFNNLIYEFYDACNVDPIEKGIEVYQHFGFDIILRTCNVGDYLDESSCSSSNWKVEVQKEEQDKEWTITTVIKTPEKQLVQRKRYHQATEYEVLEAVVEYYIKDEDDFEQFVKYQPEVPVYDCSIITRARALLGEQGLAAPWGQGAFNMVSFYRKLDDLVMDPYINPNFYKRMMEYFSNRMLEAIRQFIQAGADVICCGGNVGNAKMAGPKFFKEFILPYEMKFAERVQAYGAFYLYHNCGYASALLDYYPQINMNIYESLTPVPYGDTKLEDAFDKFDKKITLCGNIDQIDFLRNATPEQIKKEVRRVLEKAKARGNFILATTDYFSEGTPYENIKAFADAGLEYGKYD